MTILICSYLEPELVGQIKSQFPSQAIEYHPDLIPQPRYQADHIGKPLIRSPEEQARWDALLAKAEILFDFDYTDIKGRDTF